MKTCEVCGNEFVPEEGYCSCPYCGTDYLLADYPRCQCAYCREGGMSETIEEYFEKVAAVSKSLRESIKKKETK